jgi:hypothetical protein
MTLKRTEFKRQAPMPRGSRPTGILAQASFAKVRARKCIACRQSFEPPRPGAKACSPYCAEKHALALKAKVERKDIRARKVAMKGLREWIADTQVAFNAAIRARDANQSCISCATHLPALAGATGGGFDCGHYRSRGSAPHLRFDERNAHGQCKKCNRYGGGMAADYRIGLIARLGLAAVEALEADNAARKYTIDELKTVKALYVAKLKEFRKGQPPEQTTRIEIITDWSEVGEFPEPDELD